MKVIRINRKATAHDYARVAAKMSSVINGNLDHAVGSDVASGAATGAALGTIIPGIGNVVGGIIGGAGGLVKGATSSDIASGKINKKLFYKIRDSFFVMAENIGKPVNEISGNPFSQVSHRVIKDSPIKNYKNELTILAQLVNTYYPELYESFIAILPTGGVAQTTTPTSTQVTAPLKPAMDQAIRESGGMSNGTVSDTNEQFVERVVTPATGKDYSGAGKEAVGNAAIEFIASLCEKKRAGETLPPIYDKLATNCLKVEEKIERKVKQKVEGNIGAFVTDNPILIFGGLALLLILVMKK